MIKPHPFKAAIFDMDGILINSEPLWAKAEKEIFALMGFTLTDIHCAEARGLRISEAVEYWYRQFNITGNKKITQQAIEEKVQSLLQEEGDALLGVYQTVDLLSASGFRLAIASSAPLSIIEAVVQKLGLLNRFEIILSAENETNGKPHPAVYIHCTQQLGLLNHECIVFEDSINGVIAAKAAKLFTIAVPQDPSYPGFLIADRIIASLAAFHVDILNQ